MVETVAPMLTSPPDVIMGHSLGGLVASIAADRLAPRAAVYIDPAFGFPRGIRGVRVQARSSRLPRGRAVARWSG